MRYSRFASRGFFSEANSVLTVCVSPGGNRNYMPAALYPKNIKLEYLSQGGRRSLPVEITAPLLCFECEQRSSKNGESEVLRHIAGKIANRPSPLVPKLEALTVREADETLKSYCGSDGTKYDSLRSEFSSELRFGKVCQRF